MRIRSYVFFILIGILIKFSYGADDLIGGVVESESGVVGSEPSAGMGASSDLVTLNFIHGSSMNISSNLIKQFGFLENLLSSQISQILSTETKDKLTNLLEWLSADPASLTQQQLVELISLANFFSINDQSVLSPFLAQIYQQASPELALALADINWKVSMHTSLMQIESVANIAWAPDSQNYLVTFTDNTALLFRNNSMLLSQKVLLTYLSKHLKDATKPMILSSDTTTGLLLNLNNIKPDSILQETLLQLRRAGVIQNTLAEIMQLNPTSAPKNCSRKSNCAIL